MKMASLTLIKNTGNIGILNLLLLGILLTSILVSGQTVSTSNSYTMGNESMAGVTPTAGTANVTLVSTTSGITASINDLSPTTTGNIVSLTDTTATSSSNQSLTTTPRTGGAASIITTQSLTSIKSSGGSSSTATTLPLTTTLTPTGTAPTPNSTTAMTNSSSVAALQTPTTTTASGGPSSATTQFFAASTNFASTATTQSTTTNPARTSSAIKSQSTSGTTISVVSFTTTSMSNGSVGNSSSSSVPTLMMSTNSQNSTSVLSVTNSATASNGSTSMKNISCPAFTCNYSDCYKMYTNENATTCTAAAYCELIRLDMGYTVNCSAACANNCVNTSQANCSVSCCNSTGCLNDTFVSMMLGPSTVTVTTKTPDTTAASPGTTPIIDNLNKCHTGTCSGATCYADFVLLQSCSASQPHCQLKKETVNSWTAGCTTNCSGKTTCKATTPPPCYLECCNSTLTSCLWLNGTLNVPSSAVRILHFNAELIASLLCILVISFMI
ncbi:cell wall protein DAN4 isoform X2 [Takifugu rubripes]|uniref:cell wall protein DAN4 isoform X2 n=1 Tax=Takifugu rubripes TaxID=31033 RepID=UPI0011453F0E|nr:cell wall protein DAN4-like isoform X2 [Takifugu rubripes]